MVPRASILDGTVKCPERMEGRPRNVAVHENLRISLTCRQVSDRMHAGWDEFRPISPPSSRRNYAHNGPFSFFLMVAAIAFREA